MRLKINEIDLKFSGGFTDLRTISYQEILKGKGFGLKDVKKSIEIVHKIRNNSISHIGGKHPLLIS